MGLLRRQRFWKEGAAECVHVWRCCFKGRSQAGREYIGSLAGEVMISVVSWQESEIVEALDPALAMCRKDAVVGQQGNAITVAAVPAETGVVSPPSLSQLSLGIHNQCPQHTQHTPLKRRHLLVLPVHTCPNLSALPLQRRNPRRPGSCQNALAHLIPREYHELSGPQDWSSDGGRP